MNNGGTSVKIDQKPNKKLMYINLISMSQRWQSVEKSAQLRQLFEGYSDLLEEFHILLSHGILQAIDDPIEIIELILRTGIRIHVLQQMIDQYPVCQQLLHLIQQKVKQKYGCTDPSKFCFALHRLMFGFYQTRCTQGDYLYLYEMTLRACLGPLIDCHQKESMRIGILTNLALNHYQLTENEKSLVDSYVNAERLNIGYQRRLTDSIIDPFEDLMIDLAGYLRLISSLNFVYVKPIYRSMIHYLDQYITKERNPSHQKRMIHLRNDLITYIKNSDQLQQLLTFLNDTTIITPTFGADAQILYRRLTEFFSKIKQLPKTQDQ